ncbi:hypothetical protein M569_14178, partial [Genlisea aurea]
MASFEAYDGDAAARPFDEGGYVAFEESYSGFSADTPPHSAAAYAAEFPESEEVSVDHSNSPDPFGYAPNQDVYGSVPISNGNGKSPFGVGAESEGVFTTDGPILPPPSEMAEEGFALREWRRLNAIRLEEKEKREKDLRNQIIEEAQDFKTAFYEKRKLHVETSKATNREKEK